MRFLSIPLLFLCCAVPFASPALAARAPAKSACPQTLLLESTNARYYIVVFGAQAAAFSGFDLVFYTKDAAYTISAPTVDISKQSPVADVPFRSVPVLVRNVSDEAFLGATIQPTIIGPDGRCPPANIIIPSAESLTNVNRVVDPQTAALEDRAAVETGGAASALVPVAAPHAKPPSCDDPFADASVENLDKPAFPPSALRSGANGGVTVRVDLDLTGVVTAATVIASSGNNDLDAAALASSQKTTYHPARFACQSQKSSHILHFDFTK
jgi:TonB family protein